MYRNLIGWFREHASFGIYDGIMAEAVRRYNMWDVYIRKSDTEYDRIMARVDEAARMIKMQTTALDKIMREQNATQEH